MPQPVLPNKLYFRIGEVAKLVGVKPYVLRYWETEFPILRPGKTPSHHRLYRRRDVETLLEIKDLLYEQGFTIAGAKKKLRDSEMVEATEMALSLPVVDSSGPHAQPCDHLQLLRSIREDLRTLHSMLSSVESPH
ncbi:MAG: MerR family transcriptional regulator [Deltaproteobacteria bacterium]|nr:MerR family transcriptional regulator [Deltaproteobacteria bacterium]